VKWQLKAGAPLPTVAAGLVYFGDFDSLYAVESQTGQERWKFKTGGQIRAIPIFVAGMVYFGSDDHFLYALDSQTGQEKWKFKTGGATFAPTVANGMVYFVSNDLYLYALR
jgi:outer membrane protein assembly factor BamB